MGMASKLLERFCKWVITNKDNWPIQMISSTYLYFLLEFRRESLFLLILVLSERYIWLWFLFVSLFILLCGLFLVIIFVLLFWFFTFLNKLKHFRNATGFTLSYSINLVQTNEGWFFIASNSLVTSYIFYFAYQVICRSIIRSINLYYLIFAVISKNSHQCSLSTPWWSS